MSELSKYRKPLNAEALFQTVHDDFSNISDFPQGNIKISIADALMWELVWGRAKLTI